MATLVLFGRPASGKGTVGQRMADSGYLACSTGQQMRAWAAGPSAEQRALRETMAAGGYRSDERAVRIDHGIAVVVDTPEAVCRDRMLGRMICPSCGWSDHSPATICVRCGDVLQRRPDDGDVAVFERRVHDYEARVEPVIEAWARADLPLIRLDGTREVDAIAGELVDEVARVAGR